MVKGWQSWVHNANGSRTLRFSAVKKERKKEKCRRTMLFFEIFYFYF